MPLRKETTRKDNVLETLSEEDWPPLSQPGLTPDMEHEEGEDLSQDKSSGGILSATNNSKKSKCNTVIHSTQSMEGELKQYPGRLTEAEERLGAVEDDASALNNTTKQLRQLVESLEAKMEDLENRSRRSNVRLIGLPENAEGKDACTFLEKWIPEILGAGSFAAPLAIERAHRVPSGRPKPNAPPRALLIKFLNYKDKTKVMSAAYEKGKIHFDKHHIMFFHDVAKETDTKRRAYDGVKTRCRDMGLHLSYGCTHVPGKDPGEAQRLNSSVKAPANYNPVVDSVVEQMDFNANLLNVLTS
ncbi:hypothetical protein JOQ06_010804 [Pogonophryne albipinna]|uniref:L1 transposable element RRM domain-containing protein n=1 Tax=Pogonophryne albipinna TaxID=1090488 RepID=A0AAD6FES1_9TELE|nr:hypothetical protein JOQ06_010804 [Pogonophryne albipinna]